MDQLNVLAVGKALKEVVIVLGVSTESSAAEVPLQSQKLVTDLPIPSEVAANVRRQGEVAVGVALGVDRIHGQDPTGVAVAAIHAVGDPVFHPNGVATTSGTIRDVDAAAEGVAPEATRRITLAVATRRSRDQGHVRLERDRGLRRDRRHESSIQLAPISGGRQHRQNVKLYTLDAWRLHSSGKI